MAMRENMPGLARPVRMVDKSSRATDTAFSIFSSASKRASSIICAAPLPPKREVPPHRYALQRHQRESFSLLLCVATLRFVVSANHVFPSSGNQRPDFLPCDRSGDIAVYQQVEHQ